MRALIKELTRFRRHLLLPFATAARAPNRRKKLDRSLSGHCALSLDGIFLWSLHLEGGGGLSGKDVGIQIFVLAESAELVHPEDRLWRQITGPFR